MSRNWNIAWNPGQATMHPLERRIETTLHRLERVRPGQRGLVLVSGGPDSLALLHLLCALRERLRLKLELLHFDHGLRPESAREADWVAERGAALGLPVHLLRADHLASLRKGVQAAARTWRLTESRRLLTQWELDWAASGHQREDQQETLLLKWLRGAHISRLRGMDWRSGPFIRPLLETGREELVAYLQDKGETWLEDPSNRSPGYKRNRVRHELLPLLDDLAGYGIAARLSQLETQSRQLEALLEGLLAASPVSCSDPVHPPHWIAIESLAGLPALARAARLHRFVVERMAGPLDHAQVQMALRLLEGGRPTWSLDFSRGRLLKRRGERLLLESRHGAAPSWEEPGTEQRIGPWRVSAPPAWQVRGWSGKEAQPPADGRDRIALYNLPPGGALTLRTRRRGDRFHPPWKAHPVKLAAFLRDQHVPAWARDALPLVVLEGQVIAVYPRFAAKGYDRARDGADPLRLRIRTGSPFADGAMEGSAV